VPVGGGAGVGVGVGIGSAGPFAILAGILGSSRSSGNCRDLRAIKRAEVPIAIAPIRSMLELRFYATCLAPDDWPVPLEI